MYICWIELGLMKLNKRKLKFSLLFFVCWFAFWVFIVDGVIKFQNMLDVVGSYAVLETTLILLVTMPAVLVYMFTKEQ